MANPIGYKISATAKGKVDAGSLTAEIRSSGGILVALDRVDVTGDDISVVFRADLPDGAQRTELDSLIAAHQGEPQTVSSAVHIQKTTDPNLSLFVHGTSGKAEPGKMTPIDFVLTEPREIEGAKAFAFDNEPGDKMDLEFYVVMGETEIMVGRNGCDVFIPPSGELEEIDADMTKSLPTGTILRLKYHAVEGGTTRLVGVNYRFHHKT